MFKSIDWVSTWPTFLFLLCLIRMWGLDVVTWLPSFSVLALKLGLGINVTWICCEDVTGWESICGPYLGFGNARSMVTINILKDCGTGLLGIISIRRNTLWKGYVLFCLMFLFFNFCLCFCGPWWFSLHLFTAYNINHVIYIHLKSEAKEKNQHSSSFRGKAQPWKIYITCFLQGIRGKNITFLFLLISGFPPTRFFPDYHPVPHSYFPVLHQDLWHFFSVLPTFSTVFFLSLRTGPVSLIYFALVLVAGLDKLHRF